MDGFLLGGLVFATGVALGAGIAIALAFRFEAERSALHQLIGRYQQAMDAQRIPEEEL
jgi:HAMP domain-containing protein